MPLIVNDIVTDSLFLELTMRCEHLKLHTLGYINFSDALHQAYKVGVRSVL